ncbi:MAG: FISUMP domain-containing protein [Bacteroidales bacterium]|nr:FISUMP domain-containing protein [Bacteroidales bacterium]
MKLLTAIFLILFGMFNTQAQDYQISFTGTGAAASVDSVKVENLTQGTSKKLSGRDILHLTSAVGINELQSISDNALYIYPNPINGACSVDFEATAQGKMTVELYTISGKRILQHQEFVTKGHQTYNLRGIGRGIYIMRVESANYSYASKIVSTNGTNGKAELKHIAAISHINEKNTSSNTGNIKSLESENSVINMQFNTGDQLKLTGISGIYSTVFMLIPIKTQSVAFNFIACTDADKNNYAVVKIGTQTWMAENLKTTKYNDGDSIPNVIGNEWGALTTPAWCWYNNSVVFKTYGYGALYNWYALNTDKLCPTGWHLPSDTAWTTLTSYLGGETVAGGKLKETGAMHWTSASTGCDNSSGFTALGGGWRNDYVSYYGGYGAMWWSSSSGNTTDAWYRGMYYFNNSVERKTAKKTGGCAVRCIKD